MSKAAPWSQGVQVQVASRTVVRSVRSVCLLQAQGPMRIEGSTSGGKQKPQTTEGVTGQVGAAERPEQLRLLNPEVYALRRTVLHSDYCQSGVAQHHNRGRLTASASPVVAPVPVADGTPFLPSPVNSAQNCCLLLRHDLAAAACAKCRPEVSAQHTWMP